MQFSKGYQLLRFMNREHSWLSRYSWGVFAWLGAIVSTRSWVLAQALFNEFRADDYYVGLRKAARFARFLWAKFDVFDDPFFDFTMNANAAELAALRRHLERHRGRMPQAQHLTDWLYIQAACIHLALKEGQQADALINEFYAVANKALSSVEVGEAATTVNKASKEEDFSQADAQQALQDIARVLPHEEWPWYVVSGTFLGLHREGGFLAHDYDIDLGINAEEVDVAALLAVLQNGQQFVVSKLDYHYEVLRNNEGQRYLRQRLSIIKLIHKNGLQLDLFVHYTENGSCWHGSSIHRWENTPFSLVARELEGVPVLAPANADLYLTENYGDWRTPVKEFDCTTGTPNLVVARNFISQALFVKRYTYFAQHDKQEAEKLSNAMQAAGVFGYENGQMQLIKKL